MENNERVEFCCHTKMSKIEGFNTIGEYIAEAKTRGYNAIAITDTDSVQAYFDAEEYLEKEKIEDFKVIYGTYFKFAENENSNVLYDIFIYVKEQKGLRNLYKIISEAYRNSIDGKPIIQKKDLDQYRDGLLYASIGKDSEVYNTLEKNLNYYDFIGIEPSGNPTQNLKIVDLCRKNNKLVIAVSNCTHIEESDTDIVEVLNTYKKSNNIDEGKERYFHSVSQLKNTFNYIEDCEELIIENSQKIADMIDNIKIKHKNLEQCYPKIENADNLIKEKSYEKAYELYGKNLPPNVSDRIELELNTIIDNGYASIFWIYRDLVKKSNEWGYKVGSRGTVGNSFIAYLLEITSINSIEYNLPFELFDGIDGYRNLDIDLNFSEEIIDDIFEYLQTRFGKEKVIRTGTIGTIGDLLSASMLKNSGKPVDENNINKLLGIKRCTYKSHGGVFILPEDRDVCEISPIEFDCGHAKTHFEYRKMCEFYRLYKFTLVEHDSLTMIHELEKLTKIDSDTIDLEDSETLSIFSNDNDTMTTIGISEFGTDYTRHILKDTKPKNFNDLVCISALSHGTETWDENAEILVKDGIRVDEVISSRDDMFNYFLKKGIDKSLSYKIMEFIRKGKAKEKINSNIQELYDNQWKEYCSIMKEHNIPQWYIESAEKIGYLFPKAHAISLTSNAFKIAWYKVHYPKAFYDTYFKVMSDLDIKDYNCKRAIKQELDIQYNKLSYPDDYEEYNGVDTVDKIRGLEILLEAYELGAYEENKI